MVRQWLIGQHAEAVARLNCRPSAMVIHKSIWVFIYYREFVILESKE